MKRLLRSTLLALALTVTVSAGNIPITVDPPPPPPPTQTSQPASSEPSWFDAVAEALLRALLTLPPA